MEVEKNNNKQKLLIIGGGPKGLSINVKAYLLREFDQIPEVLIIDKYGIGANWDGSNGFTSGKHPLGTPAEKDICFPYKSDFQGLKESINTDSFSFSFPSFLIEKNLYQEWIDRGKPAPAHSRWAEYLKWAANKSTANIIIGTVFKIGIKEDNWVVSYYCENDIDLVKSIEVENLMITGPGKPRVIPPGSQENPYFKNGKNFWKDSTFLNTILDKAKRDKAKVAVIGGGETSASIIVELISFFSNRGVDDNISIDIINRRATIFSRGEGFHENKYFTNPSGWQNLSFDLRREFISRTDRGVFSLQTIEVINNCEFINPVFGNVKSVSHRLRDKLNVKIEILDSEQKITIRNIEYDCVINALGFDNKGFLDLMDNSFFEALNMNKDSIIKNNDFFELNIDKNLSFDQLNTPKLFLPMLSSLKQGPGFPNLSSLGRLSDRILNYFLKLDKNEKIN